MISKPPDEPSWILREGSAWVELKPTSRRIAEVIAGNCFAPGDLVERPALVTWTWALFRRTNGDTLLSPHRLVRIYDRAADLYSLPDGGDSTEPPPAVPAEDLLFQRITALLREVDESRPEAA